MGGDGSVPHQTHKSTDIVIGWVQGNGQATLRDFHSADGRTIEEDESQDYELVVGYEDEGVTVKD